MSDKFDDLSKGLAGSMPRRGVLRVFGTAVAAAAGAAVLKPFRGDASACPPGTALCGATCCKGTCSQASTSCCCVAGQTPCGPACCKAGVACLNRSTGLCGCPAGTTPCGSGVATSCCPAGKACAPGCPSVSSLASQTTAKKCCVGAGGDCTSTPCCTAQNLVCNCGGGDGGCSAGCICVSG